MYLPQAMDTSSTSVRTPCGKVQLHDDAVFAGLVFSLRHRSPPSPQEHPPVAYLTVPAVRASIGDTPVADDNDELFRGPNDNAYEKERLRWPRRGGGAGYGDARYCRIIHVAALELRIR